MSLIFIFDVAFVLLINTSPETMIIAMFQHSGQINEFCKISFHIQTLREFYAKWNSQIHLCISHAYILLTKVFFELLIYRKSEALKYVWWGSTIWWVLPLYFYKTTRKSSCVNARGITAARGRQMLTPPLLAGPDPPLPAGWTWPPSPAGPDPPPAGPDPPPRLTDLTSPLLAGPDPPHQLDLTPPPRQLDLTPPPTSWTWPVPPPASWTWPPRLDLTPPPSADWPDPPPPSRLDWPPPPPGVNWQTKWNYYLPVVLRTRAVITSHCIAGVDGVVVKTRLDVPSTSLFRVRHLWSFWR